MANKIFTLNNKALVRNGKILVKQSLTELCFTANTAGSTVELCKSGSLSIANTAYSRDRITWTTFTPSTTAGTNVITLTNVGDKVYFRNDITWHFSEWLQFKMTGSIAASGNINSMYSSTNFDNLASLSYTSCYRHMFDNCTSLTTAPALPATTLSEYCYQYMFKGCTSLTTPPALPATNLESYCYLGMFDRCTSLTTAPELPATTLAEGWIWCYAYMFCRCTSLITPPALPATTLTYECYDSMFANCTSLTTAPQLPATTLTSFCYYAMFYRCESLQVSDAQTLEAPYAWAIPTSGTFTNTDACSQSNMFKNCLGTRSSDNMSGAYGESHIYYTQNQPVGPAVIYSLIPTLTNVTASASNPTTITTGSTTTLVYTANSGYELPDSVSVTGATASWTKATGVLVLSNPTGNVSFSISGEPISVGETYTLIENPNNLKVSNLSRFQLLNPNLDYNINLSWYHSDYELPCQVHRIYVDQNVVWLDFTAIDSKGSEYEDSMCLGSIVGSEVEFDYWVENTIFYFNSNDVGWDNYNIIVPEEFLIESDVHELSELWSIQFSSNLINLNKFEISPQSIRYISNSTPVLGETPIYDFEYKQWYLEDYEETTYELTPWKTTIFLTSPTGDLLTWLQANAIKQE